jgi:hypothetical protein
MSIFSAASEKREERTDYNVLIMPILYPAGFSPVDMLE